MPPDGHQLTRLTRIYCPKNFGNFRFGNDENMNDTTWKYVKKAMFFRTLSFDFFICKSHLAIFSGGNCVCVCAAWLKAEVKDGCQTHFQSTFRSVFSGGPAVQSPRHPHPLPDKNRTTKLRQNHIELEVQKMSLFLEFFWEQNNKQIPWQPT